MRLHQGFDTSTCTSIGYFYDKLRNEFVLSKGTLQFCIKVVFNNMKQRNSATCDQVSELLFKNEKNCFTNTNHDTFKDNFSIKI